MNRTTQKNNVQAGFSLIELMIALAIIGVLAAIATPMVTGYISTSRQAVLKNNINSISIFEKNYQLEKRYYVPGTYDPSDPNNASGLKQRLGWEPNTDKNTITYVVTCESAASASACKRSSGYYITATDSDDPSNPVCLGFEGAACP